MAPSSAAPSHAQVEATTTDYDTPAAAAASDPNDPERKSPAEAGLSFGRVKTARFGPPNLATQR